ncbi:hypothetical protein GCM10010345_86110 [Streptomyces canarius]|uniref:Uncharacterized protein n=1 Tax=Streptomyces canarius TaxID=285453 RepID=A0ABQ3DB25_9ACTN|nr:hypothetical protein GCM10010345_86110 [Streptomyces canarius]
MRAGPGRQPVQGAAASGRVVWGHRVGECTGVPDEVSPNYRPGREVFSPLSLPLDHGDRFVVAGGDGTDVGVRDDVVATGPARMGGGRVPPAVSNGPAGQRG